MPRPDSPHWNESTGVCEKHGIPQIPCPKCLAGEDEDVTVHLTPEDVDLLESGTGVTIEALLPAGQEWLLARVVPPPNGPY